MKEIPAGVDNKGFTLLEVAVVLAALALVTTAAVPYFIRQAELTAAQRTTKEVSSIQEASKWYYLNNKVWPASVRRYRVIAVRMCFDVVAWWRL